MFSILSLEKNEHGPWGHEKGQLFYNYFLTHLILFIGLELTVEERRMVETMLRTHVHHLQEQLQHSTSQQGLKKSASKTEDLLRQRIENLLDTLDNVVKSSDLRNNESKELIDDLKKANR